MADSTTTTYSFVLPEVGSSEDSWGGKLNANWTSLDARLNGTNPIAPNLVGWKVRGVAVTVTAAQINSVVAKANAANPSFTGGIQEQEFTVVDAPSAAISSTNGTLQTWTLGANRTPVVTMSNGQYILLKISDGAGRTIDWSSAGVVWMNGLEPTLGSTGFTFIQLWKMGGTVYGTLVGLSAS